jgi:hypothetical protein
MDRKHIQKTLMLVVVATATAAAQTPAPPRMNSGDLRHHIYVMEGALARAVQFGALQLNREMRNFSPELFSLAGETSARGVYLDDYGVFFDVGVPVLRQSMMWSFKQIQQQDDRATRELITRLKSITGSTRDPAERRTLEATIARLEATLPDMRMSAHVSQPGQAAGAGLGAAMIPTEPAGSGAPAIVPSPPPTPTPEALRPAINPAVLQDPNRAYTDAVQRALIDAMIDYSTPILLRSDEWLTVAARDNAPRDLFAPQDPFEEVITIVLRIKGEDLAAYRSGKIDREEAKKRVQLREF